MTATLKEQEDAKDLEKLRAFYRKVAHATVNHDVEGDSAVVYPSTLGKLLEEVNPLWYYTAVDPITGLSDTSGT